MATESDYPYGGGADSAQYWNTHRDYDSVNTAGAYQKPSSHHNNNNSYFNNNSGGGGDDAGTMSKHYQQFHYYSYATKDRRFIGRRGGGAAGASMPPPPSMSYADPYRVGGVPKPTGAAAAEGLNPAARDFHVSSAAKPFVPSTSSMLVNNNSDMLMMMNHPSEQQSPQVAHQLAEMSKEFSDDPAMFTRHWQASNQREGCITYKVATRRPPRGILPPRSK